MTLAYDGTGFRGWAVQRDPQVRTVEGVVTDVLSKVTGEDLRLSVAGRTDAGVHARGQMISFHALSDVAPERMLAAANGALAPEVVALGAGYAPAGFDARFSASAREYRYVIDTGATTDPFIGRFTWHRPRELSVPLMRLAARHLLGEHDFRSFCRDPGGGRSTVRRLERLSVKREGELVISVLKANAFCHQMVRSLIGTLVVVGEGKLAPDAIATILSARDRAGARDLAPARGLTLERVFYGRRD
jgi:tRNA pseudouridine38-40 synthase